MFPKYNFGFYKPVLSDDYYNVLSEKNTNLVPYGVKDLD